MRCSELNDSFSDFVKNHFNVCSLLSNDDTSDIEIADAIRQGILGDYYQIKDVFDNVNVTARYSTILSLDYLR